MSKRGPSARPWYRKGRGWYVTKRGNRAEPLLHPDTGLHIKDAKVPRDVLEYAHAAYILQRGETPAGYSLAAASVRDICLAYLDNCIVSNAPSTYAARKKFLKDFCDQYGDLDASIIDMSHIDKWVARHPGWKRPRMQLVSVKRAFSYGKRIGLLDHDPFHGVPLPQSGVATAYLTRQQEQALCKVSNKAFALAVRVCVATGARPGAEFAAVCPKHVHIDEATERMTWIFQPQEAKDRRNIRTIRVPSETAAEIGVLIQKRKSDEPIFRRMNGRAWTEPLLSQAFRRAKKRLIASGTYLNENACMYSCRHTFAKRQLELGMSIPQIAKLLGNSPSICQKHYAAWDISQEDVLWRGLE